MGPNREGVRLVEEASEILEWLGDSVGRARCLKDLAWSLYSNNKFDAAEEAATRVVDLSEKGEQVISVNLIVPSATYIVPREIYGMQFTISR